MGRNTIEMVALEAASLRADVKEAIYAASVQGRMLAHIGHAADQAAVNYTGDATADELRACAARLRGAVLHGLVALAELQAQVGRLEQVASVREAQQT
jgi:hypothetical protein